MQNKKKPYVKPQVLKLKIDENTPFAAAGCKGLASGPGGGNCTYPDGGPNNTPPGFPCSDYSSAPS